MTGPGWLRSWAGSGAGAGSGTGAGAGAGAGSGVDVIGGDVASGALYIGNAS